MLRGLNKGLEKVNEERKEREKNRKNELFIPNTSTGSDKIMVRILSNVGLIKTHSLWNSTDVDDKEYMANTRRVWDFCIKHEGECPHCMDFYSSGKKLKRISNKFILPVLVRPYKYVNKQGKVTEYETSVGYLLVSEKVMRDIDERLDDIKDDVGDDPSDYLTYTDIKMWKSGQGKETRTAVTVTMKNQELSDEDKKLVCEFFDIDEYSPEKVEEKMMEHWEKEEKEAINRLSKKMEEKDDDEAEEGEVPPQFNNDNREL